MKLIAHHIRSFNQAFKTIFQSPIEHLINIMVLALIITMCAAGLSLDISLDNWKNHNITYPQMAIYMDTNANQADVNGVQQSLLKIGKPTVHDFKLISKQQALDELQNDHKMKAIASETIDANNNPLPDVIIVNTGTLDSTTLNKLTMQINQLPMVNDIQIDTNYANKISDLFRFANNVSVTIQMLFMLVLSMVVYNMIRLQMMLKNDAIRVSRLIGASDSFIMRPLVHYAIMQVTIASIVAIGGITLLANNINGLFDKFNSLFGNGFRISILPIEQFVILWFALIVFTYFTVFLAVRWVFRNAR